MTLSINKKLNNYLKHVYLYNKLDFLNNSKIVLNKINIIKKYVDNPIDPNPPNPPKPKPFEDPKGPKINIIIPPDDGNNNVYNNNRRNFDDDKLKRGYDDN